MLSASPWVEIDTGKMCNKSPPAAYSVWRGPGTLDTVIFAAGGSTSDRLERLYNSAGIWTRIGRPRYETLDVCGDRTDHAEHLVVGVGVAFFTQRDRHRRGHRFRRQRAALQEIAPHHA